jgi:hypothetical protein
MVVTKVIKQMYAFVLAGEDGNEVVMGFESQLGWMRMMGFDVERAESLRPMAAEIAKAAGKPYRLLQFRLVGEMRGDWN